MFENLSERLERSFKILKGEGKITEINISETLKDVRRALLDADVSYKVAKDFCDRVKAKALGSNVLTAVKPQQMMVKFVHMGKLMQWIKEGMDANEAVKKATGCYGRFKDAVKYIDPRKE